MSYYSVFFQFIAEKIIRREENPREDRVTHGRFVKKLELYGKT